MEKPTTDSVRLGRPADLPAINRVVEAAVMAWPLPLRLRRLSVPVLTYDPADATDYELLLSVGGRRTVGVAAWCVQPATGSLPVHALLHGLYVHPTQQRRGIGRSLQQAVARRARNLGLEGIVVKAERVSIGYFAACGYQPLPAGDDQAGAYPYRFWMSLDPTVPTADRVDARAAVPHQA